MRRTGIVLAWWLVAAAAAAQEPAPPQDRPGAQHVDIDSVAALVVSITGCAALHSAAAEALERGGLPAYAEVARHRAEIDQLTAMYLLAEDRVAKGGIRRDLLSYTSYVEQLTAAARERMTALVTLQDMDHFASEEDYCASLIALEDETVAKIGEDGSRAERAPSDPREAVAHN